MRLKSKLMSAIRKAKAKKGAVAFLTYHRVGSYCYDAMDLSISEETFSQHLAAFKSRYHFMTAGEVFRALETGEDIPRNGLVLTFDDGYKDLFDTVTPIVKSVNAKASLFITSNRSNLYWWDRLSLLTPSCADLAGFKYGEVAQNAAQIFYSQNADKLATASLSERELILSDLETQKDIYLDGLGRDEREIELASMLAIRMEGERLDDEDIKRLADLDFIEIGAHTVLHPRLTSLNTTEKREQIFNSKQDLERIALKQLVSFSYPYGTYDAVDCESIKLVKEAGFSGGVSTEMSSYGFKLPYGALYKNTSTARRFFCPRIATVNKGIEQLVAELDKALAL